MENKLSINAELPFDISLSDVPAGCYFRYKNDIYLKLSNAISATDNMGDTGNLPTGDFYKFLKAPLLDGNNVVNAIKFGNYFINRTHITLDTKVRVITSLKIEIS